MAAPLPVTYASVMYDRTRALYDDRSGSRASSCALWRRASRSCPGGGRSIGTPEWSVTASLWMRGILGEHYGLDLPSVR